MDKTKVITPPAGTGYTRTNGRYADTEQVSLLPAAALAAGITKGSIFDVGDARILRAKLACSANSGTSPTLDVTIQTSADGNVWRTVGTFAQKTDVAYNPSAVTAAGTTPPAITLTGTATREVNLKVTVGTTGARGTWTANVSIDGGVTNVLSAVVSAATIAVPDEDGNPTGLTLNIATGNAASDNVWTASCAGTESKTFAGLDRYVRAVGNVGGSSTPTVTAALTGELV